MEIEKIYSGESAEEQITAIRNYLEEFEREYRNELQTLTLGNFTENSDREIADALISAVKKDKILKLKLKELIDSLS